MDSWKCELGEVPVFGEADAALDIAKQAALQVEVEHLYAVRAERCGSRFVPSVIFTRQMGNRAGQLVESNVIVDPQTGKPTGFFFRFRSESAAGGSAFIETWEEDLAGKRAGPAQLVFLPV